MAGGNVGFLYTYLLSQMFNEFLFEFCSIVRVKNPREMKLKEYFQK